MLTVTRDTLELRGGRYINGRATAVDPTDERVFIGVRRGSDHVLTSGWGFGGGLGRFVRA
jgi:hypothetical protein